MSRTAIFSTGLVSLLLSGCAASTTAQYNQPAGYDVQTETRVDAPFDSYWDAYVEELSRSGFSVDDSDKNNRIIVASFTSDPPSQYIDCGTNNVQSIQYSTGEENYSFQIADGSSYRVSVTNTTVLSNITRETALEGKVNITMLPEEQKTRLRVKASYDWTEDVTEAMSNGTIRNHELAMSFTSNRPGSGTTVEGDVVACRSNGELERMLLSLVSP